MRRPIVVAVAALALSTPAVAEGMWGFAENTDPITDKTVSQITFLGNPQMPELDTLLQVQCRDGGTLGVLWKHDRKTFLRESTKTGLVRFDSEEAEEFRWIIVAGKGALLLENPNLHMKTEKFIRSLAAAGERVVIRIDGATSVIEVSAEARAGAEKVLDACGRS